MHFNGEYVFAGSKFRLVDKVGEENAALIAGVALGGVGAVSNCAAWHVAADDLFSVKIDHRTVVAKQFDEERLGFDARLKIKRPAKINRIPIF